MANKDLRLQQRAKLLARRGVNKPKVTLTQKQSIEASKKSIQLVSKAYENESFNLA